MENRITLHNGTLFELSGGSQFYRVLQGTVYLFAVAPYSQNTAGYEPVASGQLGDRIALSVPYAGDDDAGLSGKKFYLAVLDGGIYHVVSNGCMAAG